MSDGPRGESSAASGGDQGSSPAVAFATFYFFFYFMVPVNIAFLPLRFRELGFTPLQIALLTSGMSFASLVASPIFGARLSRIANPAPILLTCAAIGLIAFSPLVAVRGFLAVLACYSVYLVANNGVSIVVDTQAVRRSLRRDLRFEKVRLWGSIGFVVSSQLLGYSLERWGAGAVPLLATGVLGITLVLAILWREVLGAPSGSHPSAATHSVNRSRVDAGMPLRATESVDRPKFSPVVFVVLGTFAFSWASHAAIYIYLSLYLRSLGWSGGELSAAWNIGVVAEIVFFALFSRIRMVWSLRAIFVTSVAVTMVRWSVLALTTSKLFIFLSQILHGWSFGLLYLSGIALLHEALPETHRAKGQSWISASGPGAGSLLGRIFFGIIAGDLLTPESYQRLFYWAVGISALALILSVNLLRWASPPHQGAEIR